MEARACYWSLHPSAPAPSGNMQRVRSSGGGGHGGGRFQGGGGGFGSGFGGVGGGKPSKMDRKQSRRNAQMAKVQEKQNSEASFFWDCVRRGGGKTFARQRDTSAAAAAALFGAQTSSGINFSQYEAIPVTRAGGGGAAGAVSEAAVPALTDFVSLGQQLPPFAARNLTGPDRMKYSVPTPIQRHTIPLSLAGHDVMACAQTGSGKTVAFLLPVISTAVRLGQAPPPLKNKTPARPSALVLAPTRELAMQIEVECEKLCFAAPPPPSGAGLWTVCAYGGANARPQLEALANGVEVLIATPGRLTDYLERDLVSLARCGILVLDEADRMLDMGFEPQLRRICEQADLPQTSNRQTLMFSATFAPPIQAVAAKYLRAGFAHVTVGRVGSSINSIVQALLEVPAPGDKRTKLSVLTSTGAIVPGERTIVFVQKKATATWLKRELGRTGLRCDDIHGDRSQSQREAALHAFSSGVVDVLVATDVAARGLDVPEVAHVVQFDLPVGDDIDSYVHRIGRTGRAGHTGRATALYVHGFDPKMGNGHLWNDLRALFEENKISLPPWFVAARGGKGGAPRPGSAAAENQAAVARTQLEQRQRSLNGVTPPQQPPPPQQPQQPSAASAASGVGGEGRSKSRLLAMCDKMKAPRAVFVSEQAAGGRGWVCSLTVLGKVFQGSSGKKVAAEEEAASAALLVLDAGHQKLGGQHRSQNIGQVNGKSNGNNRKMPRAAQDENAPGLGTQRRKKAAAAPVVAASPLLFGTCRDCGFSGQGDIDAGDGCFYCSKCWANFVA